MEEMKREAERRKVELVVLPTSQAIDVLNKNPEATNAILHVRLVKAHLSPSTPSSASPFRRRPHAPLPFWALLSGC
jgi:hypothetical protein